MKTFIRQCFCKENGAEIYFANNFDDSSIDELYCPQCSDRARLGTLMLDLIQVYDQPLGIWGIKFSKPVLKIQDKNFVDLDDYFINLFKDKKIIFKFLKADSKDHQCKIIGIKKEPARDLADDAIKKDLRNKHKLRRKRKL